MSSKYHINRIAKNISKSIGILNRLKSMLPTHVKVMIYNALILSKSIMEFLHGDTNPKAF